ncbi:MAG: flagellar basal body rod protein FlgC [Planctomycetes bacterium]|nr:flagellar basal body rod protein FlgC [Planctomycetota bacterium]
MFSTFDVSASALVAERVRMNVIAQNVANAHTTRDPDGRPNPYRRKFVIFQQGVPEKGDRQRGVSVLDIRQDPSALRAEYDPHHPDADEKGYVQMPNVTPLVEMVDYIEATRAYEANVSVIELTKAIGAAAQQILA